MIDTILHLTLLALVWCVPGGLITRWILPGAGPLERVLCTLLLGIVTVAPLSFLVAITLGVPETPALIGGVSVVISAAALALGRWLPVPSADPAIPSADSRLYLLVCGLGAAWLALASSFYGMGTTDVFWHCPHLSSLYLMEDGGGDGVLAWDLAWDRWVHHRLMHPAEPAFGLKPVLAIQRSGNMAFLVQPFVFMSTAGLVAALFVIDLLIAGFCVLLAARYLRSRVLVCLIAAMFVLGAHAIASYQVNENCLALALSMGALHLALRGGDGRRLLAIAAAGGLVAGHLVGVRPIALTLAIPALVLMAADRRAALTWAGAFALALTPWALVHGLAFGDFMMHPALKLAQVKHTLFANTPLAFGVHFHPMNWPFGDQLMRGPDHPFPAFLRVPLECIQAWGAPLIALACCGLVALRREPNRLAALILWLLPVPAMLMLMVQVDYQKLSYVLIGAAPVPLLVAAGLGRLQEGLKVRAALAVGLVSALVVLPVCVRDLDLPKDDRHQAAHLRGPKDILGEPAERLRLTAASFLPGIAPSLDPLLLGELPAFELLSHARFAQRRPDEALHSPVTVWVAAPPATLDDTFEVSTRAAPDLPPEYRVPGALIGSSTSGGGALYVLRLEHQHDRARVHLKRNAGRIEVNLSTEGDAPLGPRYVSFLIVDRRRDALDVPLLRFNGKEKTVTSVTVWSVPNADDLRFGKAIWSAEPRLVTNMAWHLVWTANGLVSRQSADEKPATGDEPTLCRTADSRVVRRCVAGDTGQCTEVLLNREREVRAVRVGGRTPRVVALGFGFPALKTPRNRCERYIKRLRDAERAPGDGE